MNRRMGTIDNLIDELGKSTDKWGGRNMPELAKLCYNAVITILELQDDVKLLKRMWYHAHSEAQNFKVENTKLREDLAFERSKNSWVHEFLDHMGQKCGTKDCPSFVDYVDKLEAENAKLQKLCTDVWRLFAEHGAVHPCDLPVVDAVRDSMRELGAKVD